MSSYTRAGLIAFLLGGVACNESNRTASTREAGADSATGSDARSDASTDSGTGGSTSMGSGGRGGGSGGASGSTGGSDAGTGGSSSGTGGSSGTSVTAIVAVGYAGLRVVSYDLGKTWEHKQTLSDVAADDPTNLRAVAYGNGVFVAAGHRIFTSPDGATWTERTNPQNQWLGGLAFGNGRFVGAGGYGYSLWSADGETWTIGGTLDTEAARSCAFGNGTFTARTDPGNWWQSTDGTAWTNVGGGHTEDVAFCGGAFKTVSECGPVHDHGVYIRSGGWGSGVIERSTDGTNWDKVNVGFVGDVNGITFGTALR